MEEINLNDDPNQNNVQPQQQPRKRNSCVNRLPNQNFIQQQQIPQKRNSCMMPPNQNFIMQQQIPNNQNQQIPNNQNQQLPNGPRGEEMQGQQLNTKDIKDEGDPIISRPVLSCPSCFDNDIQIFEEEAHNRNFVKCLPKTNSVLIQTNERVVLKKEMSKSSPPEVIRPPLVTKDLHTNQEMEEITNEKINYAYVYNCENPDPAWEKKDPHEVLEILKNKGLKKNAMKINIAEIKKKFTSNNLGVEEGPVEKENFAEMYEIANKRHPRKIIVNEDNSNELADIEEIPICEAVDIFNPCKNSIKNNNLDMIGSADLIYFRLLKSLIISFLVITIINAPLMIFYFKNHSEKKITTYTDALYKTTIGNIGSTLYNCEKVDLLEERTYTFPLDCGIGMKYSQTIALGISLKSNNKKFSDNSAKCGKYQSENDIDLDLNCEISDKTVKVSDKNTYADISLKCPDYSGKGTLFFVYSCYDQDVNLGIGLEAIKRPTFSYVVVAIDIVSGLIIFITFKVIDSSKDKEFNIYNKGNYFVKDYTLRIRNLELTEENKVQEINDLIAHFNKLATEDDTILPNWNSYPKSDQNNKHFSEYFTEENKPNCLIFDINYPTLTSEKVELIEEFREIQSDAKTNIKKRQDTKDPEKLQKLKREYATYQAQIKQIREELKEDSKLNNVKDIYITFRNPKIAFNLRKAYRKTKCNRCCIKLCCQGDKIKKLYYKDKWLDIIRAKDEPSNINWENITYNKCKKLIRYIISLVCTIIIIAVTLFFMILFKNFENDLKQEYNTDVNCESVVKQYKTEEEFLEIAKEEFLDKEKISREKINLYCFCYNQYSISGIFSKNKANAVLPGVTDKKPCKDFSSKYLTFNIISLVLIIIIPLINSIASSLMIFFTHFEKNKTLSEDMAGIMSKVFTIQLINTGIILVLVNMKVDEVRAKIKNFPLFAGKYIDITPGWCENVGVVILFSMLIGIITPHASALLFTLLTKLKRCIDGGGWFGKDTSKETKKEYYELYTGPYFSMESRYATILSTLFVVFFYSSAMPLLYGIFFIFVFLTFIVDKILILRYYRKSPVVDLTIASKFINYTFIGLLIHFCFAIWIYGNPSYLAKTTDVEGEILKNLSGSASFRDNILIRIKMKHNFPILVVIVLLLVYMIFKFILIDHITCKTKSKKKDTKKIQEPKKIQVVAPIVPKTPDTVRNENIQKPPENEITDKDNNSDKPSSENRVLTAKKKKDKTSENVRDEETLNVGGKQKKTKILEEKYMEIGLALSFNDLAKIYAFKEIQYYKLLLTSNGDSRDQWLINNTLNVIYYIRQFMIYKIIYYGNVEGNKERWKFLLNKKFDEHYHNKDLNLKGRLRKDQGLLKGDASYNLIFNTDFEAVAYYELLKGV